MAFAYCSGLTSVIIPNSVTSIGKEAFIGTEWYKKLPDGILYLGSCLFGYKGNKPEGELVVKEGTKEIASNAFGGCTNLTSIIIPNSVTCIGDDAFNNTGWYNNQSDGLLYLGNWLLGYKGAMPTGELAIKDGTKVIRDRAFQKCSGLTSVTIPNSVTSIGDEAFAVCSGLTSVTIPNSVTSIGKGAFTGCSGLTSIAIPNSVTSIGDEAFAVCSGLTSVTIPNSVTSIGYQAFGGCSGLTSVNIPNSMTSIEGAAFAYCSNLTSVTIPNSVTSIGYWAFGGCSGLTSVIIPNSVTSIGEGAFYSCTGLTSIIIPNSVTSIGKSAFSGCTGLTSITIPNSVTSIREYAFYDCTGLTEVYSLIEEPFAISNSVFQCDKNFHEVYYNVPLYVPDGTVAKYLEAYGWKNFGYIAETQVSLAGEVTVRVGQTATADICLNNETTKDFTAYQFDLVLPKGIDIAKNAKGKPDFTIGTRYEDNSQSLTVQKVEGTTDTYRVVSFSLAKGVITGTKGALFTVKLQADADLAEGEYIARMENIVMTRKDGTQFYLKDATLKITVNRIKMGDTNGDGIVNVTDIVEVVNCIMGRPSAIFIRAAADLNGDNIVNVTDIVMIVDIIMSDGKARSLEPTTVTDANDWLTLDGKGGDSFGLSLHNDARYVAAQMDIVLTEGQTLENVSLSKNRCGSHLLNCQQTGRNTYCVMLFSMTNKGFGGFDGSLLDFSVTGGTGGFSVENIVFVKADETQRTFDALYGQATGIGATLNDKGQMINDKWYDLSGRRLDGQPNRKGLYVKDGKKQVK